MDWPDIATFHLQAFKGSNQESKEMADRQRLQVVILKVRNSPFFNSSSRHTRIRLQKWMQELSKYQFNDLWRTNKFNYLRLLHRMCDSYCLLPPFTQFPHSQLHILQKHQIQNSVDILQRYVKISMKTNQTQLNTDIQKQKRDPSKQKFCQVVKMKLSLPLSSASGSNLVRPSYHKISPATTISSEAWKRVNKIKLPLSKDFEPKVAKSKRKQYWESNSQIGSGTPKYLHHNIGDVNVILSEEQSSTERSEPFCDCIHRLRILSSN